MVRASSGHCRGRWHVCNRGATSHQRPPRRAAERRSDETCFAFVRGNRSLVGGPNHPVEWPRSVLVRGFVAFSGIHANRWRGGDRRGGAGRFGSRLVSGPCPCPVGFCANAKRRSCARVRPDGRRRRASANQIAPALNSTASITSSKRAHAQAQAPYNLKYRNRCRRERFQCPFR
jgi:hypothetical protein